MCVCKDWFTVCKCVGVNVQVYVSLPWPRSQVGQLKRRVLLLRYGRNEEIFTCSNVGILFGFLWHTHTYITSPPSELSLLLVQPNFSCQGRCWHSPHLSQIARLEWTGEVWREGPFHVRSVYFHTQLHNIHSPPQKMWTAFKVDRCVLRSWTMWTVYDLQLSNCVEGHSGTPDHLDSLEQAELMDWWPSLISIS